MFREKLPEWQEAYMERLIKEYAELLNSDKAATENFGRLISVFVRTGRALAFVPMKKAVQN